MYCIVLQPTSAWLSCLLWFLSVVSWNSLFGARIIMNTLLVHKKLTRGNHWLIIYFLHFPRNNNCIYLVLLWKFPKIICHKSIHVGWDNFKRVLKSTVDKHIPTITSNHTVKWSKANIIYCYLHHQSKDIVICNYRVLKNNWLFV